MSCAASIIGHVLYGCAYKADFLYLILIGRIVNGFGFTMWMYCKRYCSDARIVGVRRRTTLASFLVMGQGLGMSLGPFAGGLLYKVGFGNAIFNGFTSPAWMMAVVWCIFWVCVRLFSPKMLIVRAKSTNALLPLPLKLREPSSLTV